jgi:6-phosphogluconolactonase
VNEVKDGTVSAFAIGADGKLTLLNKQSSRGAGPCHVVLDKTGRYVIVSNYSSGSVAVLPVAADGKLGEASDVEQHAGKSLDPTRQESPHAHGVTLDPANAFAFACDLGLDKVMVYRFDAAKGQLTPHDPPFVTVKPGAGPRHMAFRPDGKFAYVINELNSTITALAYDGNGGLKEVESVTTLPRDYEGPNFTAEIAVHPSGEFLYASNRGHESVVLYTIDAGTGKLTWVEGQSAGGKTPRHFGIEPGAKHMAIANQESDTVLAARIDGESGRLKPSGVFASCPSPTCAVFFVPPGGERQEAKE